MADYLVRATAANAGIRAFAAATRDLTEQARRAHDTSPVVTAALGRLLTGGVMMGAMLKGEKDLLTLQVCGDGPIRGMTVTADSQGNVKGYANDPQVMSVDTKPELHRATDEFTTGIQIHRKLNIYCFTSQY